jgi:HTH-type transcriptional regulator/antitoxin HigA
LSGCVWVPYSPRRLTIPERQRNQIEPLTVLIEHYAEEHYPIPDASPADVLRFLIEQNGLSQRDLIPELGNEATVSLVLSDKRQPTREHVERPSRRFHVSPALFF